MLRGIALAVVLATTSFAAHAATYLAQLTGTVTSQIDPGFDPNISVGDKVFMTARFTDDEIFDNGTLRAAVMYGLPESGDKFWNIKLNGLTWVSVHDEFDGLPFDFDAKGHPLAQPYFELLSGGKISGPNALLTAVNNSTLPLFYSGPTQANILSGEGLYGNTSKTPGFVVTWDSSGKLTTVPEPSVWALTIVGFGLVGAASRRRSRTLRAISARSAEIGVMLLDVAARHHCGLIPPRFPADPSGFQS